MPTAAQLGLDLNGKRAELVKLFADHKNADGEYDLSSDQLAEVAKRNDEIAALQADYEKAAELEAIEAKAKAGARAVPAEGPVSGARPKSRTLPEIFETAGKAAFDRGEVGTYKFHLSDAELKTVITIANVAPPADRLPSITGYPVAVGTIDDLLGSGTTSADAVTYYEETAQTDNTASVADGSAVTDNAKTFTLRSDAVEAIKSWIPVTLAALKDTGQLEGFIRTSLMEALAKARTTLLLTGNGTPPNITGLLNRTNIQTQAKGADPAFDALFKAMTLVRTTGAAEPDAVIMNPTDWQSLRLARTADGVYILGNPSDAGQMQVWGLPVRLSPQITQGTALVGAFRAHSAIWSNGGIEITVSNEHSTYFTEGKAAILAYQRLALTCTRGQSLCKVTGL